METIPLATSIIIGIISRTIQGIYIVPHLKLTGANKDL